MRRNSVQSANVLFCFVFLGRQSHDSHSRESFTLALGINLADLARVKVSQYVHWRALNATRTTISVTFKTLNIFIFSFITTVNNIVIVHFDIFISTIILIVKRETTTRTGRNCCLTSTFLSGLNLTTQSENINDAVFWQHIVFPLLVTSNIKRFLFLLKTPECLYSRQQIKYGSLMWPWWGWRREGSALKSPATRTKLWAGDQERE